MSTGAKRGRKKKNTQVGGGPVQQGQMGLGMMQGIPGMDQYSMQHMQQGMQQGMPGMQPMMQHGLQHGMQQIQGGMPPHQQAPAVPSMLDMVTNAIATLSNRKGSSLQAIKKFITEKYGIDFASQPQEKTRVSKAVKQGVQQGLFFQEKNSYKLANQIVDPMRQGMYGGAPQQAMGHQQHHHQHQQHGQHQQHQHQQQQFNMHQQFPPISQYGMHPQFMQQQYFPQGGNPGIPHQGSMHGGHDGQPGMPAQPVKEEKKKKKRRKKKDAPPRRRGAGGLSKPMNLSSDLAAVCGGHSMGRTDVVRSLWRYIKTHGLQNPTNKKEIMCDEALRRIFRQDQVDMFDMNRLVSTHLSKPADGGIQEDLQQQTEQFYSQQVYQDEAGRGEDDSEKQQWH